MTRSLRRTQGDCDENARYYYWVCHSTDSSHCRCCCFRQDKLISSTGSGESGKSTIVKQMKIIHQNGYTVDELALYRLTIYKNLIDCSKALIGAMRQFEIQPRNPANLDFCDYLVEYTVDPDPHTPLQSKVGTAITSVWKDGCIEELMERQSEFYLMDSAP